MRHAIANTARSSRRPTPLPCASEDTASRASRSTGADRRGDRLDEHLPRLILARDRPPRQPSDTCRGQEFVCTSPRIPRSEHTSTPRFVGRSRVLLRRPAIAHPRRAQSSRPVRAAARISPASTLPVVGPPSITWRSVIFAPRPGVERRSPRDARPGCAIPAANLEDTPDQLSPGCTRPPPLALRLLGQGPSFGARRRDPRRARYMGHFGDDLRTQASSGVCSALWWWAVCDAEHPPTVP